MVSFWSAFAWRHLLSNAGGFLVVVVVVVVVSATLLPSVGRDNDCRCQRHLSDAMVTASGKKNPFSDAIYWATKEAFFGDDDGCRQRHLSSNTGGFFFFFRSQPFCGHLRAVMMMGAISAIYPTRRSPHSVNAPHRPRIEWARFSSRCAHSNLMGCDLYPAPTAMIGESGGVASPIAARSSNVKVHRKEVSGWRVSRPVDFPSGDNRCVQNIKRTRTHHEIPTPISIPMDLGSGGPASRVHAI